MFKHLDYLKEEPDLSVSTIEGTRYYKTPTGKMYPSITSVTSFYNRDVFIRWRKKVGDEKANKITRESTFRGTKFHDVVEHYLNNEDINTSLGFNFRNECIDIDLSLSKRNTTTNLLPKDSRIDLVVNFGNIGSKNYDTKMSKCVIK